MEKEKLDVAVATQDIKVFIYDGLIGIQGKNVEQQGMGFVIDTSPEIFKISQEAYDALLTMPKNGGSFAELNTFKADDGKIIFGWMGGPYAMFDPAQMEASRDTDYTLLKEYITEVEIPQDFKDAVDTMKDDEASKADDQQGPE